MNSLNRGLIEKEGKWALTANGKQAGGEYKETTQYGTYIVWPENMNLGTKPGYATRGSKGKVDGDGGRPGV